MTTISKSQIKRFKVQKRLKIHRDPNPLMTQRNLVIGSYVGDAIKSYLTGNIHRHCVTCGSHFKAKHRNHHTCSPVCYKIWSAGTLRQRKDD